VEGREKIGKDREASVALGETRGKRRRGTVNDVFQLIVGGRKVALTTGEGKNVFYPTKLGKGAWFP